MNKRFSNFLKSFAVSWFVFSLAFLSLPTLVSAAVLTLKIVSTTPTSVTLEASGLIENNLALQSRFKVTNSATNVASPWGSGFASASGVAQVIISSLQPGRNFTAQVERTNLNGSLTNVWETFSLPPLLPKATTLDAVVSGNSVTLNGSGQSGNNSSGTWVSYNWWFELGSSTGYGWEKPNPPGYVAGSGSTTPFQVTFNNVLPGTKYFRLVVEDLVNPTAYSAKTFIITPPPGAEPAVTASPFLDEVDAFATDFLPDPAKITFELLNQDTLAIEQTLIVTANADGAASAFFEGVPAALYNVTASDGTNTATSSYVKVLGLVTTSSTPKATSEWDPDTGTGEATITASGFPPIASLIFSLVDPITLQEIAAPITQATDTYGEATAVFTGLAIGTTYRPLVVAAPPLTQTAQAEDFTPSSITGQSESVSTAATAKKDSSTCLNVPEDVIKLFFEKDPKKATFRLLGSTAANLFLDIVGLEKKTKKNVVAYETGLKITQGGAAVDPLEFDENNSSILTAAGTGAASAAVSVITGLLLKSTQQTITNLNFLSGAVDVIQGKDVGDLCEIALKAVRGNLRDLSAHKEDIYEDLSSAAYKLATIKGLRIMADASADTPSDTLASLKKNENLSALSTARIATVYGIVAIVEKYGKSIMDSTDASLKYACGGPKVPETQKAATEKQENQTAQQAADAGKLKAKLEAQKAEAEKLALIAKENQQKTNCIDAISKKINENLIKKMASSTISWVNSGLKGRSHYADPTSLFKDLWKKELSGFTTELAGLDSINYPFAKKAAQSIVDSHQKNFKNDARFTLNEAVPTGNAADFYNDFEQGGWAAYQEMNKPKNNALGFRLIANSELESRTKGINPRDTTVYERLQQEWAANNGFFSDKVCVSPNSMKGKTIVEIGQATNCSRWENKTPGFVIANKVITAATTAYRQAEGPGSNGPLEAAFNAFGTELLTSGLIAGSNALKPRCSNSIDDNQNLLTDGLEPNCHVGGIITNEYRPFWNSEGTPPTQ